MHILRYHRHTANTKCIKAKKKCKNKLTGKRVAIDVHVTFPNMDMMVITFDTILFNTNTWFFDTM